MRMGNNRVGSSGVFRTRTGAGAKCKCPGGGRDTGSKLGVTKHYFFLRPIFGVSLTTTSFWLPAKSEPVPHPGTADSHIPCDLGDPVDPEYTVQFRHPGYGHTVLEPCPQRTHPSLTSALVHPFGTRPCYIPSDVTLSLYINMGVPSPC